MNIYCDLYCMVTAIIQNVYITSHICHDQRRVINEPLKLIESPLRHVVLVVIC